MRRGNVWLVILLVLAGVGMAAGAYYYGKQQAGTKSQIMTEATNEPTAYITPYPTPMPPTPTEKAEALGKTGPVVVYESEGAIPAADKAQLKARNADPLIDYYAEQSEQGPIATVTVSFNTEASKNTYPYTVRVVFDNAVHMGFAVERKASGLGWWFPECMTQCQVSQQFKTKYPEIAKILGY
jgi:hypothetical protein